MFPSRVFFLVEGCTWYEFLPEVVLNNTAPEHSVPLVLALHGNGDDPVQFVDNNGWLNMACENRLAIVAPYFQMLFTMTLDRIPLCKATCAVAHYMLDTYPALDPSQVVRGRLLHGRLRHAPRRHRGARPLRRRRAHVRHAL